MSEGMRRRNVPSNADKPTVSRALDSLQNFDMYAKVQEDCMQKSKSGGAVTVVTALILVMLFLSELNEFFTLEVIDSVTIDTRMFQKLHIRMNVTFPHLQCDEISVNSVDSSGDLTVNNRGAIETLPLDANGRLAPPSQPVKAGTCLSCQEGETNETKCCNTCLDLKEAYMRQDLSYFPVLGSAPQCKDAIGCRVAGEVTVNKVSGNVHIALGQAVVRDGRLIHEFNVADVSGAYNTSHEIHYLAFGKAIKDWMAPLDDTAKTVRHGAYMFHYYVKLVPTIFIDRWGQDVQTNQFSVTDSALNVVNKDGRFNGLPGVFFVYDFSPFMIKRLQKAKPWSYLFTNTCAILGGVFTIASLVEVVLGHALCGFGIKN